MKRLIAEILIISFLLQPFGLVSPALAETVEMRYDNTQPLHAPKVVNGVEYQYDANGNLVNDGERVVSWNYDNMPIKIEKGGKTVEFFYDADGRRIIKQIGQDRTNRTVYVNRYYQEPSTKYYFAGDRRIARSKESLNFFHHDHLGSTILATDPNSQKLAGPLSYFPYGNPINNLTIEQFSNLFYLFTGQEYDSETDLYNYKARLYNPTTGNYISADTVGEGNRYSYAENNPLIFTDPTGHVVIADGGGGGGADLGYQISGTAYTPKIGATGVINPRPGPDPLAEALMVPLAGGLTGGVLISAYGPPLAATAQGIIGACQLSASWCAAAVGETIGGALAPPGTPPQVLSTTALQAGLTTRRLSVLYQGKRSAAGPKSGFNPRYVTPDGRPTAELISKTDLALRAVKTNFPEIEIDAVFIGGSQAKGTWKPTSDLDLVILASRGAARVGEPSIRMLQQANPQWAEFSQTSDLFQATQLWQSSVEAPAIKGNLLDIYIVESLTPGLPYIELLNFMRK